MYSEYSNSELLDVIQGAMKELRRRRGSTMELGLEIIYGLSPSEMTKEQRKAGVEAIQAVRESQVTKIREEELRKAVKKHEQQEAAKKQIESWTKKKRIAGRIKEVVGSNFDLNVWSGGDKRVYIDGPNYKKVCFFVTGNRWNPPGTLELSNLDLDADQKKKLIDACHEVAEIWKSTKFSLDQAAAWQAPQPQEAA